MRPSALRMRDDTPHLDLSGTTFEVTPEGGLYDPHARVLIVSDLHLEKGSAFARRGVPVPPYDTVATLARLAALIARRAPATVICLGDSFEDDGGPDRLSEEHRGLIAGLQRGRDWLWVAGNHDPAPHGLGGVAAGEIRLGALVLRHEPSRGRAPGEIAGHLHPAAVLRGGPKGVRRRCLASDGARAILPAFGAYAGGLDLRSPAFAGLFDEKALVAFMLDGDRVYPVAGSRCL